MQILFKGLCFDHYPYHRPGLNTIKYWNNYNYTFDQREEWSKMLINDFIGKLVEVIDKANRKSSVCFLGFSSIQINRLF